MQNEMRDRLIELIDKTFAEQFEKRGLLTAPHTADDLIENGVILPPCKVGSVVYVITTQIPCHACIFCTDFCHKKCPYPDRKNWVVKTATVCSIEIGEICKIRVEIEEGKVTHSYDYTYWFNDIGKTVFLTRKEAERVLKEKNNGT